MASIAISTAETVSIPGPYNNDWPGATRLPKAGAMTSSPQSLIIAGGGLSGCLAALALTKLQADVSVLLVESGPSFGGEHTWSFFDSDVSYDARWLIDPLVTARWDSYDVLFPKRRRTLRTAYNSVTSDRLDRLVRERLR